VTPDGGSPGPAGDAMGVPVDAVIFDMDGVIVDTEPVWDAVRVEFARRHGRSWGPEDHPYVAQRSSREWADATRMRLGIDVPAADIERAIVEGVVDRLHREGAPPIDGAVAAVQRVAATHRTALASSAHPEIIAATLAACGLDGTFDAVVSADDVGRGKPHPDVFLEAARRIGAAPGRCVVIEDSLNGILAARAAGMVAVLVPNPSMPPYPGAEEAATFVLDRLEMLDVDRLAEVARPGGGRRPGGAG
jgi:HAD superfamily hydrolase (TIGR01509 family)